MSGSFFDDLGIPKPDVSLEVGGGTHAEQTGLFMQRYESVLINSSADLCIVVGDVTSNIACAVCHCKKNENERWARRRRHSIWR